MKKWQKILAIAVVVFCLLGIIKNQLIKSIVTVGASAVTGTSVKIDSLAFGVFRQAIRIKGFRIYHPKGFPKGVLIDIPEVSVEYDLVALLQGKLHVPSLILDMKEMVIIKNKDGQLNVDALKVAQKKDEAKPGEEKKKKTSKQMPMQIDMVTLSLGKVVVKDYTKGDPPQVTAFDIGVKNKTFKNITSAEQLAVLVMANAMGPTALKGAGIYGAATVLGVAFLPAGVAGVLIGKDSGASTFKVSYDKAYDVALKVVQKRGTLESQDKNTGQIKANVDGTNVAVDISKKTGGEVQVTVNARKMMLPKPEVAEGILYQISEELK